MTFTTYRIDREDADRLLFLMHGYSAEQHHLAAYVPLVDPDERFTAIAPRAPHDLDEGDGASWWHIDFETLTFDTETYGASLDALETFVAAEAAAAGIPLERCVVGGFSQGGYLALALAGRPGGPRYAGVWAICCGMPEFEGHPVDLSAGDGRPALFQWGTRDPIIDADRAEAVVATLGDGGWALRHHAYDMAHSQTIEMMIDAREWLAAID